MTNLANITAFENLQNLQNEKFSTNHLSTFNSESAPDVKFRTSETLEISISGGKIKLTETFKNVVQFDFN